VFPQGECREALAERDDAADVVVGSTFACVGRDVLMQAFEMPCSSGVKITCTKSHLVLYFINTMTHSQVLLRLWRATLPSGGGGCWDAKEKSI
jgi:hypothetical protein